MRSDHDKVLLLLRRQGLNVQGIDFPFRLIHGVESALRLAHLDVCLRFFLGIQSGLVFPVGFPHALLPLLRGYVDQNTLGNVGIIAALITDRLRMAGEKRFLKLPGYDKELKKIRKA
jgi:hypothetical protein